VLIARWGDQRSCPPIRIRVALGTRLCDEPAVQALQTGHVDESPTATMTQNSRHSCTGMTSLSSRRDSSIA
jgi:hypothetical protein